MGKLLQMISCPMNYHPFLNQNLPLLKNKYSVLGFVAHFDLLTKCYYKNDGDFIENTFLTSFTAHINI